MTAFRILAVLLCVLAAPAYAQVENQDYKTLHLAHPPAATEKVEVIEFFSYACPHCFAMQPHVEKWAAELPKDVAFTRVPVSFGRREWGQLSRAYYALEATGDLARLDDALVRRHSQGSSTAVRRRQSRGVGRRARRGCGQVPRCVRVARCYRRRTMRAEQLSRALHGQQRAAAWSSTGNTSCSARRTRRC